MSGYSLGAKAATQPGTPVSDDEAFQPFWDAYHSIDERYAGGEVDRQTPRPGRDQGDDRCAGRPVFLVPDVRRVQARACRASTASSRASAPRSRTQAADGTPGLLDARAGLPSRDHRADRRVAGRRRPASWPGDLVLATDGVAARRPDRRRAPATRSADRRAPTVTLTIQRGADAPFDLAITRDVIQQQEVVSEGPRRRHRRLRPADRLLGHRGGGRDRRPEGPRRRRADQADPRPARQPGRLRHGRPVDRERLHRRRRRSSGSRTRTGAQIADPTPRPVASRPSPDLTGRLPHRRRQRLGERDRRGRPPGHQAGHPRRPAVLRQGHRPAVAGAAARAGRSSSRSRAG